jgi:hypothetical protein
MYKKSNFQDIFIGGANVVTNDTEKTIDDTTNQIPEIPSSAESNTTDKPVIPVSDDDPKFNKINFSILGNLLQTLGEGKKINMDRIFYDTVIKFW